MKILKNLLIVSRSELQGKWWHRLANVLIYGSTFIFFVFSITFIFINLPVYTFNPNITSRIQFECRLIYPVNTVPSWAVQQILAKGTPVAVLPKTPVKICYNFSYLNVVYIILLTLGWFILWESILYRATIYIIYGSKK
jgi:hypothetical protein